MFLILLLPITDILAWLYFKEPIFLSFIGKQKIYKNMLATTFNEIYTKTQIMSWVCSYALLRLNLFDKFIKEFIILQVISIIALVLSIVISKKVIFSISPTIFYLKEVINEHIKITR